jgi:hypothetical protein
MLECVGERQTDQAQVPVSDSASISLGFFFKMGTKGVTSPHHSSLNGVTSPHDYHDSELKTQSHSKSSL